MDTEVDPNNLKDWKFDKEAPQNFCLERVVIADRQGTSEDKDSEAKLMQSETNSSSCSGLEPQVEPWFEDGLKFKCTGCGKCCTGSPGYVFLSNTDLENLSNHFHLSLDEFTKKYTRYIDGQYALLDRPTSYDCVFLKDNKCTVYEARPVQCRTFPWWVHHLRDEKDWAEAGQRCEGINHPDAELVPSLHIQEQCLTYLDNLLDQNFD